MFLCPSVLQLCLLVGLHLLCLLLLLPDSSLCVMVAKKEHKPGHAAVLDHFTTSDEANCSSACLVSPECHANGWYVFWKKSSICFLINCSNTSSCKNISVDSVLAQLGETDGVDYNYRTAQDSSDSNSTTEKQFWQPTNNTLSSSSSSSSDLTKVPKLPELSNISPSLSLSSDSFHSSSDSTSSERGSSNNGSKFASGNSKYPQKMNSFSLSSSGSDQEPVNQLLNDSLPPPPLSKATAQKLTVSPIQSKEILKLPNQSRQLKPDEPSSQTQHPANQLSEKSKLLPSTQSSKPAINYHPEASLQPSKQPLPLSTTVTQSTTILQPHHDKDLTSSPTEAANGGSTTKTGTNKPLTAEPVSTAAIHTTQPGKNTITDATVTVSVAARTPPPASTTTPTKTTATIPTPPPPAITAISPATTQKTTTSTTKITATVKTVIITSVPAIKEPASSSSSSSSPAKQEPKAPTTEMPLVRFTSASPVGTSATASRGTGPSASTTDNNQVVAKGTRVSVVEVAGDALTSHLVDTASLLAVLLFGLLFFLVTVAVFVTQAYESYRRKDYTQVDYLINGMYTDSGV